MGVNVDFLEWQKTECIRLNITLEQHNKLVEAAKTTGSVMNIPFGGAYKRILAATKNPPNKTFQPNCYRPLQTMLKMMRG